MRRLTCLLSVALCMAFSGCAFQGTKRHLDYVNTQIASLSGEVTLTGQATNQVVVVLWNLKDSKRDVVRYAILPGSGSFTFYLGAGSYGVMAFSDRNRDLLLNEDETVVVAKNAGQHNLHAGDQVRVKLILDPAAPRPASSSINVDLSSLSKTSGTNDLGVKYSVGEVTTLADVRFTPENAKVGLWEPVRFLKDVGVGLFFLQPYDEKKIPVLFIHGADACPKIWQSIVHEIDTSRFQPWVFYYPTGVRLRASSETLCRMIADIQAKHRIKTLCVVAHSMGGLVEKGFLNEMQRQHLPIRVPFVASISTPWGGHSAAEMGVKNAPAVVPAWHDMLPKGPFIQSLWETPLPPGARFHLLFGYNGKFSAVMDRNNDGSVTLESELHMPAQEAAFCVRAFNETHTGILDSAQVALYLRKTLDQVR